MSSEGSPRQKMINMMYLVLIALLALNVSKEVLNAFVLINAGLVRTTDNFSEKNAKIYQNFAKAAAENPGKAGPWKQKADDVKNMADNAYKYLGTLKEDLVMKIDQLDPADKESRGIAQEKMRTVEGVENKSDLDKVAEMMILNKNGEKLKKEIESFRDQIVAYIKPKDEEFKASILASLDTEDPPPTEDGVHHSWESEYFEHLPAIAVLCNLSQFQSSIRNAESEVITYLEQEIDAGSISFNKVEAIVIPEKTYVTKGDTFRADVFLAASDSLTAPMVTAFSDSKVGSFDTVGAGDYSMTGEFDSLRIIAGKGKMRVPATTVGEYNWGGVVYQKTTAGTKAYPFKSMYQVAEASVNVSPDKMNVFYIGPDNPVTVSVSGFASNKVKPSISGGSIRPDRGKPGKYIVVVNRPGKAIISVQAETAPGKFTNMGKKEFRVKRVPPPITSFMGIEGEGAISTGKLRAAKGLLAKMKNFDFELPFKVTSFDMSINVGGLFVTESGRGNKLTDKMKKYLAKAKKGQRIIIENVKAKSPKTPNEKISGVTLKVI